MTDVDQRFDDAVTHPDDDLLGIQPYAARLAEFINKFTSFTIGVYGAWGSGKTSFVRLMEGELGKLRGEKLKFIAFEAWPYKTTDDLWRALVQKIAYELQTEKPPAAAKAEPQPEPFATRLGRRLQQPAVRFSREPEERSKFADYYDLMQRLDDTRYGGVRSKTPGRLLDEDGTVTALVQGTLAALGNLSPLLAAMRGFFGFDAKVDAAKLLQQERDEATRNRIRTVEDFRGALEGLFNSQPKDQLVCVFIDDLDRCMPDVALDLLEALKIFLGRTSCIFIIAADEQLIAEGLRIRYKELLAIPRADEAMHLFPRKGKEYFEKIIQLGIRVPDHATPHVHRFIAAQFPQWLACTDLIQGAVGSNPRRLKQYCTWLDYKYTVIRDPKAAEDWPLLTKLIELHSRSSDALELVRQLARDDDFAKLMKSVETGSPAQGTALELYELAAANKSIARVLAKDPLLSAADPAEIEAVAGFVDVIPDSESTRMLKSRDAVLIRLFEKARTGTPDEAGVLEDDLVRLDGVFKKDPSLAGIVKQLAQRDDWSDVMDSVESALQGGANARKAHQAAAPLMDLANANEEVKKALLEPQLLSTILPRTVRAWAPRSAGLPADEIETIKAALDVRLRAARHFVKRRKFVKLDALDHSWPELFQYVRTDMAGLRTFESNVSDPSQRTEDLPPRWLPYARDEKLTAFLRLRPFLADFSDEELKEIAGLTAGIVRPAEAGAPPPPPPPPPAVVTPPQPAVPTPAPAAQPEIVPQITVEATVVSPRLPDTYVGIAQREGQYELVVGDQHRVAWRAKLDLDVARLSSLSKNLAEFSRSQQREVAGRLREFGNELYQTVLGDRRFDELASTPRRFCFSVPQELESLPWELLYVPSLRLFLGLSPHHSLVRFIIKSPESSKRLLPPVEPPLRILSFLGKPNEIPVRLQEEGGLLRQLAVSARHVTLEVLSGEDATFQQLEKKVDLLQPHVLRFSGYRDTTGVAFADTRMEVSVFLDWLVRSRVRLVDLTGCYLPAGGMEASPSFASDLVKGGVPMVIGTTSPISAESVLLFTRDFYRTLADGRSIEEGLVEARGSQSKERWNWSAFALFTSEPSLGELRSSVE